MRGIYRRRKDEHRSALTIRDEDFGTTTQPRFPFIPVGLYMGAISLAAHKNIDMLFMLTEPPLADHLSRLGVSMKQIGTPLSNGSSRVPAVLDVQSTIRNMRFMIKPLWRTVNREIESSIPPPTMRH